MAKVGQRTKRELVALGARLREVREANEMSQAQLAKRAKMTRPNYARIEKGRVNITIDTLLRICDALDVDLAIVFDSPVTRST